MLTRSPVRFVVLALSLSLGAASLAGCSKDLARAAHDEPSPNAPSQHASEAAAATAADALKAPTTTGDGRNLSTERKIIRRAELAIEASDPPAAQRKATELAEKLGGFVVTSDAHHYGDVGTDGENVTVSLVLRVPADRFGGAMEELRKIGTHVSQEKVSGQDVTEEFVDLEARIRTQKALELQLLEIMKDAKSVKDALEVQRQLAEVRGEIERVEGRKKLLEDQTSLSTITMTIGKRMPIAPSSGFGFGESTRRAGGDFVKVSAAMVTGAIRAAGALGPVVLFVLLPTFLIARAFWRRSRRARANPGAAPAAASVTPVAT